MMDRIRLISLPWVGELPNNSDYPRAIAPGALKAIPEMSFAVTIIFCQRRQHGKLLNCPTSKKEKERKLQVPKFTPHHFS